MCPLKTITPAEFPRGLSREADRRALNRGADMPGAVAQLWEQKARDMTACRLCRHACVLSPGQWGLCGVRHNKDGALYTLTAERIAAANLDPVEKKPLYHFLPGTVTFSIGTEGCNFACAFCQNHELSQRVKTSHKTSGGTPVTPERIADAAKNSGAQSISYTYSEPTIFFELVKETSEQAITRGLKNILVSNGYESRECLEALGPLIHAANFDLKAFSESFYREVCNGRLGPVLDTLVLSKKLGWWVEITTLLIPGINDSPEEIDKLSAFIRIELGADTPWHISRYRPEYFFKAPPTPVTALEQAAAIGRKNGLRHVYIGNVPGHHLNNTYCPVCGKPLVKRIGYHVELPKSKICPECATALPGMGWPE